MAQSQHTSSRDMGESPLVPGHSTPLLTITHSSAQLPALQDWGRKREHTSQGKIQKQEEDEFGAGGAEKCAHRADCAQMVLTKWLNHPSQQEHTRVQI